MTVASPVTVTLVSTAPTRQRHGQFEGGADGQRRGCASRPEIPAAARRFRTGRPAGTGKRKRPSASVTVVAGDVGFGVTRGDLRARDHRAGRIGHTAADARVVNRLLCRERDSPRSEDRCEGETTCSIHETPPRETTPRGRSSTPVLGGLNGAWIVTLGVEAGRAVRNARTPL